MKTPGISPKMHPKQKPRSTDASVLILPLIKAFGTRWLYPDNASFFVGLCVTSCHEHQGPAPLPPAYEAGEDNGMRVNDAWENDIKVDVLTTPFLSTLMYFGPVGYFSNLK